MVLVLCKLAHSHTDMAHITTEALLTLFITPVLFLTMTSQNVVVNKEKKKQKELKT